jgi:hypothetical protein
MPAVNSAAQPEPRHTAHGCAMLLPASETTRKEVEFESTERPRDDLDVNAVFAELKIIGGKKPDQVASARRSVALRTIK